MEMGGPVVSRGSLQATHSFSKPLCIQNGAHDTMLCQSPSNPSSRYTSRIAEWVHYVPIQVTYSDLYDALTFFRTHEEAAAKIAAAGKQWSQQFWRNEDMSAYLYR